MNERVFGEHGEMSYLLPEDSQLRLRQLREHLEFLARLVQQRTADASPAYPPEVLLSEWRYSLGLVIEQLAQVLDAAKGPARYAPAHASPDEVTHEAAQPLPSASASTPRPKPYDFNASPRMLFGVTLDQVDALNLLLDTIRAYADAVSAEDMADFAEGTLSRLGYSIFDRAGEALALLGEIQDQPLPDAPHVPPSSVGEIRATYRVSGVACGADAVRPLSELPSPASVADAWSTGVLLH
ncbi:XAC0095 family protein [Pseudoxanthomonas winnipegensis]|uniref:XAC0095 family protein n=1 Tax=Pseudoxanthomonas winnipegensis TaxID=2480810 RepID=UPI003F829061